jgi:DNA repair protein RadC
MIQNTQGTYQPGRFIREVQEEVVANSSTVVGEYLRDRVYTPFETFDQEEMYILLLNSRLRITHEVMIYRGTVNQVQIRPAEIFKEAVRLNVPSLILAHNHPSGDPTPSTDDILMTRRLNEAAMLLDLRFFDHLIVGEKSWVSLKELNLGFDR